MKIPLKLDNEGNYPLPDEFLFDDCIPSFDSMWKSTFQFFPQVPNDYKLQESHREFAKRVYDALVNDGLDIAVMKLLQKTVNEAYNDGTENGGANRQDIIEDCINALKNL